MLNLDLKVWEKQPGERDKRWEAFQIYRDMSPGERTLAKVAFQLGKSETLMERWSAEDGWRSRVDEFDQYLDREATQKKQVESERAKVEMTERQTKVVVFVQNRAVERFRAITNSEWNKIPIHQLTDIFLDAAKFERVSRGLPSDSIELEAATPERFRQRAIIEGRLFLHEIMHDFPALPEKKCVEIVCKEFDILASDLGYDEEVLSDERMDKRLTVAEEYEN
jgi:hypothetical protein